MVARLAQKPLVDVRKRIEKVLADLHRKHFGAEAKVRVKDRGYKDYLDLFVTSPKFRGMLLTKRASLVGGWLREGLTQREYSRVASLLPLTPAEERKLPPNGH
jgi:stress-induced morphogen